VSREHGPDLDLARDPEFWRQLCPALGVATAAVGPAPQASRAPEPGELDAARAALRTAGHTRFAGVHSAAVLAPLAEGIGRLQAAGWPTAFAFVYDEAWAAYRALDPWLRELLGPGYLRMPDFWAFRVTAEPGRSGFPPHRERQYRAPLRADGSVVALSAWLALSPATPENGCLHVVPMDEDPEPRSFDPLSRALRERFGSARPWRRARPGGRPLPADPGDLLVLNPWVLHWSGAATTAAAGPRISLALEFQRGDEPPLNEPLAAPHTTPEFGDRVRLCAQQVVQYRGLWRGDPQALAVAEALAGEQGRRGVASR
jgi:ectoine hydroxylase-related dioxygenase (phytanoyl-CoA dioxygenase family)